MVREPLDLGGQAIAIERLDDSHKAGMQRAPPLMQETAIRHFLGERVLEGISQLWVQARLIQEFRLLKVGEATDGDRPRPPRPVHAAG